MQGLELGLELVERQGLKFVEWMDLEVMKAQIH